MKPKYATSLGPTAREDAITAARAPKKPAAHGVPDSMGQKNPLRLLEGVVDEGWNDERPANGPCASAVEVALSRVKEEVVSTIVAVSGGYDMAMLVAAHRLGFNLIAARSEAGAAWMTAGLAWEARLPALLFVITSPGVYGTVQALHYAYTSRVPLVLVSGESSLPASVQAGDGVGGPSVTRVTSPLTAWSADVTRPSELPGALLRAVRVAAVMSRPVHLNVPARVAAAEFVQ